MVHATMVSKRESRPRWSDWDTLPLVGCAIRIANAAVGYAKFFNPKTGPPARATWQHAFNLRTTRLAG